jgi:hypothetical protein
MKHALRGLVLSIFRPRSLIRHPGAYAHVTGYGWIYIVLRWLYYSIVFLFRDYHGRWRPFAPTPFGLDLDTYARLQRILALPFGFALMLIMSLCLTAYLRARSRRVSSRYVLNILGATFFLPFVLVQPIDQLIIALWGWALVPVSIVHTAILFWESLAATLVISGQHPLSRLDKIVSVILLMGVWILITGILWR